MSGSHAERLLDKIVVLPEYKSAVSFNNIEIDIDYPDLGQMRESVRRWGAFAAHGEQFTHHAQVVQLVIRPLRAPGRSHRGDRLAVRAACRDADVGILAADGISGAQPSPARRP